MGSGFRTALSILALVLATAAFAAQSGDGDGIVAPDPPFEGDPGSAAAQHAMPPIPSIGGDVLGDPDDGGSDLSDPAATLSPPEPVPTVEYDASALPAPVRALRQKLLEAAASGDPDRLRPIIEANGELPDFGDDQALDDPIAFLKSLSGDAEGREILAILLEVLDAGFVHVDAGTPDEMYVWPYFARYPMEKLTPPQIVELFKLIYAGDWEDMRSEGHYLFYRVGIRPDGTWRYFTAGD